MKTELWISHSHLHSHSQSQTCAIRYDSVRVSSRLEIYVAQKLRFDGRGSSCECRGQRQGQRLLVVRRLGVAWGATGGGDTCRRNTRGGASGGTSAAARGSATSGTITSTDSANCQAYKIIRDTR